jgi:hypothetical protein
MFIYAYIKNINLHTFSVMSEIEKQGCILNGLEREEFTASIFRIAVTLTLKT